MDNIHELNDKKRIEWLVDKLIEAEEELDDALDRLEKEKRENFSLRARLNIYEHITFNDKDKFNCNCKEKSDDGSRDKSDKKDNDKNDDSGTDILDDIHFNITDIF